ncbi:MAG: hypothetical protein JO103_01380 [Candidatus Eremiobacteraeota bacterium]|nr:hypothetical protein [Candidatus Eremiobacteraeota bacterium]MBV9409038.1 hypothetical protein [Candidatus Eremiobacteraeota bacterium]
MTQPQPVESVFSRSWELLTRNWIIIVPGIVIGLIMGAVVGILAGIISIPASVTSSDGTVQAGAIAAAATATLFSAFVAGILAIVAFIATEAFTVGMAGAAWTRGTTTLADGSAAFQEAAGRILIAAIGLLLLGIVAAVLTPFTFGLAFLAFVLFTLYTMPAAIVGGRPGFDALRESFQITTQRFVPTLIIAIIIGVISFVASLLTLPLHFIPLLGPIVSAVITQIVVAYGTLVVVGEYLNLRAAGAIPPAGAPTVPSA